MCGELPAPACWNVARHTPKKVMVAVLASNAALNVTLVNTMGSGGGIASPSTNAGTVNASEAIAFGTGIAALSRSKEDKSHMT